MFGAIIHRETRMNNKYLLHALKPEVLKLLLTEFNEMTTKIYRGWKL